LPFPTVPQAAPSTPRCRGTLKEEGMTRKLALIAGALFSVISAGALHAQTSTSAKPNSSSMQHAPSATAARPMQQDTTTARASTKAAPRHVWTKVQITEAQQGLAKAGFYKGQPNGKYDRRTRKAITAYQKSNKLPVTGRLDDSLLTKLHTT
jgi:hypothetical protein